jgi:nitrite reductase/ring-hydroxylating ferredoxin subunit
MSTPSGDESPLRLPIPKMQYKRDGRPANLYNIVLQHENLVLLVAHTRNGYVGIPIRCPHARTKLANTGYVDVAACTLFCQTDAITYSLDTGECVENLTDPPEDPGVLKLYPVEREGDCFIVRGYC